MAGAVHRRHGGVTVGLLELPVELSCVYRVILRSRWRPGRLLGATPGNKLRSWLEAFVVTSLFIDFPLSAVGPILGRNGTCSRDASILFAFCNANCQCWVQQR